ncbi:family 43 glycosylhydrolase [Paraglaciecola sp. L3A3]|uniref:family 43 glycosylhydrolase n=1 Tax=Paraglaciecola sp. L3A3 TaxID=2686358 RepID=UPI00131D854E|nr:family 43 glycosylhydrolase [Paraglaciecola sp. L3A3]
MKCKTLLVLCLSLFLVACIHSSQNNKRVEASAKVLIPKQANNFVWIYQPKGDRFFGPDTQRLKQGQWYQDWVPNDHTFIKGDAGLWHIFGITHPYVPPSPKSGVHEGEMASFHAVSTVTSFKQSILNDHYVDQAKVLPPHERPGEPLSNHAPTIVKKNGLFHMIYGPSPIRLAVSKDLYKWQVKGNLFSEKDGARDPSLLFHDGQYYLVYCTQKSVALRTSTDLVNWSEPKIIFTANTYDPESPSLIFHNNTFYLFVCSWNGIWDGKEIQGAYQQTTYVLNSNDPVDFGLGDEKQITTLQGHAPEIFQDENGDWYISSAEWPNRGVSVDSLVWQ